MGFTFVGSYGNWTTVSGTVGDTSTTLNIQSGDLLVGMYGWRPGTDLSNVVMSNSDGTTNVMTLFAQDHSALHSGLVGYKIAAEAGSGITFRVSHAESVGYRTWIVFQFRPDGGETVELDGGRNVAQGNSTSPISASFSTTGTDEIIIGFDSKYALRTSSAPLIAGASPDGELVYNYGHAWYKIFTETQSSITTSETLATATNWIQYGLAFKSAGGVGIRIPVVMHKRRLS